MDKENENDIHTSQIWEKIINFTNKAPDYVDKIHPFMNSLDSLFNTKDGKEAFSHIFDMFKHVNQHRPKKNQPQSTGSGAKKPQPPSLTGNHFYDLFNSPGMKDIVKEVMSVRAKPGRKRK